MRNQEKEPIKSLNKFASFIDKMWSLEQQSKILETKWSLLQQQTTTHSSMDIMFKACINNQQQHLETLAQEKLRLEAEPGNMLGLVEDLKNKCKARLTSTQRWGMNLSSSRRMWMKLTCTR